MKYSLSFLIFLLFANILGNALLPKSFINPEPGSSSSEIGNFIAKIEQENPSVVFIGNSIIGRGINFEELEKRLGSSVVDIRKGGSGSAIWYLVLKNAVVKAQPIPPYVVFVFEDYMFSEPNRRVGGKNKKHINKLSLLYEPVLEQLAYNNFITPEQAFLEENSALFTYRSLINERIINIIKYPMRKLFHLEVDQLDKVVGRIFDTSNLNTELLTEAEEKADLSIDKSAVFTDFSHSMEFSFLPYMLEIARKNNTTLIFVHYRSRIYVEHPKRSEKLENYFEDMEKYLLANGAIFIDESANDRLQIQHYANGSHLNEEGQYIFTDEMSKVLLEIFNQR